MVPESLMEKYDFIIKKELPYCSTKYAWYTSIINAVLALRPLGCDTIRCSPNFKQVCLFADGFSKTETNNTDEALSYELGSINGVKIVVCKDLCPDEIDMSGKATEEDEYEVTIKGLAILKP